MTLVDRKEGRRRRHARIRRKLHGTAECPRLALMVSNRHMYVQFIDDDKGMTLASASTLGDDSRTNVATARALGQRAAQVALGKGIKTAIVDRGGYKFHGRIKAIVDALNQGGVSTGAKEAE